MRILSILTAAVLLPGLAGADTRVTERTYDLFDRLETETVPLENGGTATVHYSYYPDGRRRTVTDAFGRVTFYEYDGRGNLKRVTINQGLPDEQVVSYTYWPDNLLRSITRPNGTVTSYDYDRADRLTSVVTRLGESVLLSYAYTYDANGNRLTQVETNGGAPETTSYTYDDLNRLSSVTYPDGTSASYAYDAVGNRVGETLRSAAGSGVSDKTAVFDPINRLTSLTDAVDPSQNATLAWDANGNLLSKTTPAGVESYSYDTRDLLVQTQSGALSSARFAYDAFGRRYLKLGLEGVRQYLYDDTSTLHELGETGLEVAKYEYDGDRLLSFVRVDEERRFHHQDALGSVVALSDASGSVVARYRLDAWGRYRVPSELSASANRFGFTGYLFDQETELYYAKARFYDPEIGRFTTQDSVLGQVDEPPSLHRYSYAHNRPTLFVDLTGHDPVTFVNALGQGLGWEYLRDQAGERAKQNTKEFAGDVGMGISIAAARTLSMAIDPETGEITIGAPGDNPTQAYLASQPQPQNLREHRVALIADLGFAAAPLLTKLLPKEGTPGTVVESSGRASRARTARTDYGSWGGETAETADLAFRTTEQLPGAGVLAEPPPTPRGINLLDPRSGGRPFVLPQRPRWQDSEADFAAQLQDFGFRDQVSYVAGKEVTHATRGSVRPDLIAQGGESVQLSVDVKNYNFGSRSGRSGAVRDILDQVAARQANLPAGTRQGIILDARGQVVSKRLLDAMADRIARRSGGAIQRDDIHIQR